MTLLLGWPVFGPQGGVRPPFRARWSYPKPSTRLWSRRGLSNHKSPIRSDGDVVNLVKAFLQLRNLQFPERACDGWNWNLLLSGALIVPLNGIAQSGIKKVRYHAKSSFSRYSDITSAIAGQRICIIDHKRLFCGQAGSQQKLLAMPGPQHIQADADMSVEEALTIESSFSGALQSHED